MSFQVLAGVAPGFERYREYSQSVVDSFNAKWLAELANSEDITDDNQRGVVNGYSRQDCLFSDRTANRLKLVCIDQMSYAKSSKGLPSVSCVYFLLKDDRAEYVGQTTDLKARWGGHRFRCLLKGREYNLKWIEQRRECLVEAEAFFLDKFKPRLNTVLPESTLSQGSSAAVQLSFDFGSRKAA